MLLRQQPGAGIPYPVSFVGGAVLAIFVSGLPDDAVISPVHQLEELIICGLHAVIVPL